MKSFRKIMLSEYNVVEPIAREIAEKRALAGLGSHPTYDVRGSVDETGVTLYAHEQEAYSDDYEIVPIEVTWEEIDNKDDTLRDIQKEIDKKKREMKESQVEWKRKQYEQLKKELGL